MGWRDAPHDPRTRAGTVHHVSFRVDDLEAALDFYVGVLGCEVLERPPMLGGRDGAWLKAGDTEVHLIVRPAGEDVGRPPTEFTAQANHVAFRVADLDAAAERFDELGIAYRWGKAVRQLLVRDPSGNVLEFQPGPAPSA